MRKKTSFRFLSGIAFLFSLTLGACTETTIEEPVEKTPETRAGLGDTYYESRWGGELTGPVLEPDGVLYTNKNYSFSYKPLGAIGAGREWMGTAIGLRKVGTSTYNPVRYATLEETEATTVKMDYTFPQPGQYELKGHKTYTWMEEDFLIKIREGEIYASRKYTVILPPITNIRLNGPEEPIEIGKTYRLNVSFDNPNAGTNPVFNFTAKDTLFGNEATLTPVDNKSCDIVFTKPGKYEINATLKSNSTIQAPPLSLTVYSKEITITHVGYSTHTDCHITAFYYSDIHPDNKFKFTITSTPDGTQSYAIKKVDKDNITMYFYKEGEYTLRTEIEGAPEIYTERTLSIGRYIGLAGITLTPDEPIEIGKAYLLAVPEDLILGAGDNPDYYFTVEDRLFGNKATLTKMDNRSSSIVFTQPGEYVITAWLTGNTQDNRGSRTVSVYSKEISIQKIFYLATGEDKGTYGFQASYYSDIHPNPEFKFTILDPNPNAPFKPMYYSEKESTKKFISYKFYVKGEYILRTEIVGAPQIYTDYPFTVTTTADLGPIIRPFPIE